MTIYAKLGGLAAAVLIMIALLLGVTGSRAPPKPVPAPASRPAKISFMNEDILLAVGLAFGAMGNFDAARSQFALIRQNKPSSALGYRPVAGSFIAEGQLIEALYWMREAQAIGPKNLDHSGWMIQLYDCLEDYETAGIWAGWLNNRLTNQPLPMAMKASHHYVTGEFDLALQYSNLAINFNLPDRWGSDAIFMRIKRDEALASGDPESGIRIFAERHPALFDDRPELTAGNITQATDLALLLKMAGRTFESDRLLKAVLHTYSQPGITGRWFRGDIVPLRAEALAIRGEKSEALKELRQIIDRGWRIPWRWKTDLNPNFDSIRGTPEFREMVAELEADMAWQRARVQAISVPGPAVSLTR